jgi:hypothetical protein
MAQVVVSDFKYGEDRTRPRIAGIPGTLWLGENVHIGRGGDIERAKKFVPTYEGLEQTFGLGQVRGQLFVFGSETISADIPNGLQYQRLEAPNEPAMVAVLCNTTFDAKHYVIAEYADGSIHHFYDGDRVTELNALVDAAASYETLAEYLAEKANTNSAVEALGYGDTILITAQTAGTAFTLTTSTSDVGGTADQTAEVTTVQANVAAVAEVRATGTVTVTGGTRDPNVNTVEQITVNSVELLPTPVSWVTSHSATATALIASINNGTSDHGYSAEADGAEITITAAPGTGATPNGYVVTVTVGGDVTYTKANMADGVTEVEAVAQISKVEFGGTFEATDRFTLTLDDVNYVATGRASAYPTHCLTYKGRIYLSGTVYRYNKLNDPTDWTDAGASSGAGFINMASDSEGNERLVASQQYNSNIAIFSRKSVRVYTISTDAQENIFVQTIESTGTLAARSVLGFATTEVLYLDEPGIRSLQIRDVSGNAYVDDIGSPIDTFVKEWVDSQSEEIVRRGVAVVEPTDGRYMLAVGTRVFVLSYFPRKKVTAWSHYDLDFTITDFARIKRRLYCRDADTIYLYGGQAGDTYPDADEQVAKVHLPFVAAQNPALFKRWTSFDMACTGVWHVQILVDPDDDNKFVEAGTVSKNTYDLPALGLVGEFPMVALVAECSAAGNASISNITLHYDARKAE